MAKKKRTKQNKTIEEKIPRSRMSAVYSPNRKKVTSLSPAVYKRRL